MVAITHESRVPTYHAAFNRVKLDPDKRKQATQIAQTILQNKSVYLEIQAETGVPWWFIGPVHNREASLRMNRHLHEGSPLTGRTINIPKNRPKDGQPPFTFKQSAVDALKMAPHSLHLIRRWSVERSCYEWERYNGLGYLRRDKPSPYVFSWTNIYEGGKFVADGVYRAEVWDKQAGCVAVVAALAELDPEVAEALKDREPGPPKSVKDRDTKTLRDNRKAGGALGGAGGGIETGKQTGTIQPDQPFSLSPMLTWSAIGIGVAVVIIATVLISRKLALIDAKWRAS